MTTPAHDEALRQHVEPYLFYEARLLDEHAYETWLQLWADDARYWVPAEPVGDDPRREVSIIYDDGQQLADRVFRLTHPASHAFQALPRLARVVANVEVETTAGTSIIVRSAYVLVANRHGEQTVFAGRVRHTLVPDGTSFLIQSKTVDLTATGDALRNLTFLP